LVLTPDQAGDCPVAEQLLGWLYVGATVPDAGSPEIEPDITGKITSLDGG